MKKNSRPSAARVLAGLPFVLAGLFLLSFAISDLPAKNRARRADKMSITPSLSVPVNFSGTYDPHTFPCGTPLNGPFIVLPTDVRIVVQVSATIPTNDLTVTL